MKIKITLIAFFASVLFLTSCMKNEVSPGIEEVRSAYAAFLNAKAQAEIIKANADAELTRAQAAVQNAIAAMNLATAAGTDAATALALETLAQTIETNKIALAAAQRADDALQDAYLLAVQTAKETAIALYFGKYTAAMAVVTATQQAIYDKQRQIVMLNLDLVNGTDSALTAAKATLAADQAALAVLQDELVAAKALLGDADATVAKIADLYNDSTLLRHELANLAIEKQALEADTAVENAAYIAAAAAYTTASTAYTTALTALANAETTFLSDTIGTHPVPDFWKAALDSVTNTNTRLTAGATDTATSATLYYNALDTIALGTTDIDALIALHTDTAGMYTDSINLYNADTVAKLAAYVASVAAWEADSTSYNTKAAQLQVLTDSLAAQRLRFSAGDVALAATIGINSADSTILYWEKGTLATVTIPAAVVDTAAAFLAYNTSVTTQNAKVDTAVTGFAALLTARNSTITGLNTAKTTRIARVAVLTAALPDLTSDYLYHQTFMADLLNAVTLAEAYKEAVRPDYETWKAAYYDDFVAGLQATVDAKLAAKTAAATAKTAAADALALAFEPMRLLDSVVTLRNAELATLITVKGLYTALGVVNDNFLTVFEAAIVTAQGTVTASEIAVGVAEWTYANGLVNYDKFMADLAELEAELVAQQAQVDLWKALLDEALAN